MIAEGETELRDLIVQNLEASGVLNKIKAELRAGVFLALEEEGDLRKKIPIFNQKFDDYINTNEGKLALSVVREFLEYFNLNFTLSVFDPEVSNKTSYIERAELCKQLKLNENDGPVLSALLDKKNVTNMQSDYIHKKQLDSISEIVPPNENCGKEDTSENTMTATIPEKSDSSNSKINMQNTEKTFVADVTNNKTFTNIKSVDEEQSVTNNSYNDKNKKLDSFFDEPASNTLKEDDNNHDSFFDEPVPSEKPSFLNLYDGFLGQNKPASTLPSNKNDLVSLRNLPSLTHTASKDTGGKTGADSGKGNFKKESDVESSEEMSDRQINSEESIEEEIEEDFSAGLDDLLNSSLSLADDATSDQTVSQTSVVEGVDHLENL